MHCCSYPLSTFLPNGSEDLPFISCGFGRTRTFNLWIKDYISDSNRNYNFHYIKKWPLCVVCHFLIDGLQLSVHCSAIELQTHIVVSINYTSEIRNSLKIMKLFFLHLFCIVFISCSINYTSKIRNSLKIMKLFSSSLFIYLSFPYIILKKSQKV